MKNFRWKYRLAWAAAVAMVVAACGAQEDVSTQQGSRLAEQSWALTTQDNINRLAGQPENSGVNLQQKILQRAEAIAPYSRPYRYDGIHDCYGYVRQVWNALLADGDIHSEDFWYSSTYSTSRWLGIGGGLPVGTLPDANWVYFTNPDVLVPGDVLATHQGHRGGDDWHGAIYAGKVGSTHYIWDSTTLGGLSGAYKRVMWSNLNYYYRPVHDLLLKPAGGTQAAVGRNPDGRLEVFMRGRDGLIYRNLQATVNGAWSSTWSALAGPVGSNPVVANQANGSLVMAARGTAHDVVVRTRSSSTWGGWVSLGGVTFDDPALGRNQDGRLQVLVRGDNGRIFSRYQTVTNGGFSPAWDDFGGTTVFGPVVAPNADGRLEIFARWMDGVAAHKWQLAPNGSWSGWGVDMGGHIKATPVVLYHPTSRLLYQFVRGRDGSVFYMRQTAPNSGWTTWMQVDLRQSSAQPAVAVNSDGSLVLAIRGTDNAIYVNRLNVSTGGWGGWLNLGGVATSSPALARMDDGRMIVIVRGNTGLLHESRQLTASGSSWTGWAVVGDSASRF